MRLAHLVHALVLATTYGPCVYAARTNARRPRTATPTSSSSSVTAVSNESESDSVKARTASTDADPYCITLKGDVDFDCSISGGGFTGDCKSGAQICSLGTSQSTGGGTIFLHAPGSTSAAVTLIECFFPNDGSQGSCDVSMVDGYTYDAVCTGTLSFGYPNGPLWKGTSSPYGCSGGGAVLDAVNSACTDPNGHTLSDISQVPPFFRPAGSATLTAGAIVAAYQSGSYAELSGTSADATCTISGGMPKSGSKAKREASDASLMQAEVVEGRKMDTVHHRQGAMHLHAFRAHFRSLSHLLGESNCDYVLND